MLTSSVGSPLRMGQEYYRTATILMSSSVVGYKMTLLLAAGSRRGRIINHGGIMA